MKRINFVFFTPFFLLTSMASLAQTQDSVAKGQQSYLQKSLNIDAVKAQKASAVIATYKSNVNTISTNNTLSEEQKRAKIDNLIAAKNKTLKKLLSDQQLQQLLPTSERSAAATNH
jgi:hypothetical protein